jgi:hypothetical protein
MLLILAVQCGEERKEELSFNEAQNATFAPLAPQFWGAEFQNPLILGDLGGHREPAL